MYGIVYMTTNVINGKKYIGQHQCKTEKDSYLGSGTALVRDIKEYGRKCFVRETLYVAESQDELNEKEIEFIAKYNAVESSEFYNFARGGLCVEGCMNPMYGHVYTEEERKKIGNGQRGEKHWNYGQHWSEEIKAKISESHKGLPAWNKGIPMREESKKKLSAANSGKERTDLARQHMREAHLGRKHPEEVKQKIGNANKRFHENGGRRSAKPVVCVETNTIFASIGDASRFVNRHESAVSACIRGKQETAGGYHWRFATQEEIKAGKLVTA